ncbi:MAG: outer membrane lipoprotein chaperone LolA [Burkholderiales bacterium]|nr:outer membrane lipoprotein chaperone LolA [Burkholderiales bacterium]
MSSMTHASPFRRRLLAAPLFVAAASLFSPLAHADGLQSLESFMRGAKTGRADFTQTVTSPARDGQAPKVRNSSGSFEFSRPGRFRFVYRKPFEQTIVADGKTMWMHDVDLNQVTARAQAQALGSTPAAILASSTDIRALESDFTLKAEPDADGLQWVSATPKVRDGQLQSVRVGFRGADLAVLDILDSFGQRSRLAFGKFELNPQLPASTFEFKTPAGADVIRQ